MRALAIGAMNQCARKLLALVALLVSTGLHAQPDQSVIIVRDENGHRMRGTYAPSFAEATVLRGAERSDRIARSPRHHHPLRVHQRAIGQ